MKYNNLSDIPILTAISVVTIGLLGAWSNYLRRDLKRLSLIQKIYVFIMDTLTASTIAIITFLVCSGYGFNEVLSVGIAGAVAHQGIRAVYILELLLLEKIGAENTYQELKEMFDERRSDKRNGK